jgi:TolB-like protein/DNA-binding winged helix-turn-helix (wHTH) protein
MHPAESRRIYRFDVFEVDTLAHELRRQGVSVRLQEQPYQILLLLLERAGQAVTREELRHKIWPSSVFVDFDHGLNNAIARLREALGDDAATPRFIGTIPRVGYRFVGAVAVDQPEASEAWNRSRWPAVAASVATAALLVTLLTLALFDRRDEQAAVSEAVAAPSIAVLPFVNMSSDPENEHFSDGLTEELVSKLAGIRGLRVVARTSAFRFKDKPESAAAIADALQVDHLIEGSVRRSEGHLRITAQLIDARTDEHIWSRTFDRDIGDIFQIQEEIALAVASALKVSLIESEELRIRTRGTNDPEAHRLYLIAQSHLLARTKTPDPNVAKLSLEAAIERDPKFAAAHAGLARYHFRRAWGSLVDTEESSRLGAAAAERAVALDPESSDAHLARANFEFWRYRFRGDYGAQVAAEADMQRAIELDPANSVAFEDFGRAIIWHAPETASGLLERAIQVDLLCTGPNIMIATLLGNRGQLDAARKRCADLLERYPDARVCSMAIGTLETYYGNFEQAVPLLQASEKGVGGAARIQLWSVYMSAGDRTGALQWLDFGKLPMEKPLSDAARFAMDGRYDQAFAVLDRHRPDFPYSRLLELPAAKFALLAGKPQEALEILEQRMPDLARGIEPISARNVLPALDLVTARTNTGAHDGARELLERITAYLDGPEVLRLPLFAFQRARAHALAGEPDAALRALERAYDEGLRTTWALDLRPQSFLYIDPIQADPAFAPLREDPRFGQWLERIRTDDAAQLERLNARQIAIVGAALPPS